MSLATALHRALVELRERYGYDGGYWDDVAEDLMAAYLNALEDERPTEVA
jgi:hypothetical protein